MRFSTEIIFYIIILGLGILYYIISILTDFEFIQGHFKLGIPYSMMIWGIFGLMGMNPYLSFIVGFILPMILFGLLYNLLDTPPDDLNVLLFQIARVTIPIPTENKMRGEITLHYDGGSRFLVAKGEDNLKKEIPKNTSVRIIDFIDDIAIVTSDVNTIHLPQKNHIVKNNVFKFLKYLIPSRRYSGYCMICYGSLNKSKRNLKCPVCKNIAHEGHFASWLSIKSFCPNCRTNLSYNNYNFSIMIIIYYI